MEGLFNAIKDTVTIAVNNDGVKLGTSIVNIVGSGVGLLGKLFGFQFQYVM